MTTSKFWFHLFFKISLSFISYGTKKGRKKRIRRRSSSSSTFHGLRTVGEVGVRNKHLIVLLLQNKVKYKSSDLVKVTLGANHGPEERMKLGSISGIIEIPKPTVWRSNWEKVKEQSGRGLSGRYIQRRRSHESHWRTRMAVRSANLRQELERAPGRSSPCNVNTKERV